ncbi:AAA-ATPase-like protein [Tanacetum coccineum]
MSATSTNHARLLTIHEASQECVWLRSVIQHIRESCGVFQARRLPQLHMKIIQHVTLSGFLNFIDGLLSSCGDERIIIFTTNRKDKLDPALLRPGRMDVHINMSYRTPCGFRLLTSNYLGTTQHDLFGEIEDLIRKVEITPAEVAEQLLKDNDLDISLCGLIKFFDVKKKQNEKAKAKEEENMATKESEKKQELQKH